MNGDYSQPRLLHFDTLFDLSLSGEDASRHAEWGAALSLSALLCCSPGDEAIIDADADGGYLSWLSAHGFSPRIAAKNSPHNGFLPVPWGWNREAEELFASFGCESVHPPFESVAAANSRELSNRVAHMIGSPSAGRSARSRRELESLLAPAHYPYVVKPCHGSAGSGFTIVTDAASAMRAADRSEQLFAKRGAVSVERWLDRVDDYSANFLVGPGGEVGSFTCHRAFIDRKGIFRGIDICGDVPSDYARKLRETAECSARELHAAGYFGPAGIDAFSYSDGGAVRFNPICEINARLTMGEVARSLKRVLGGACGRTLLVVTGGAEIPPEMREFSRVFGADAYDPSTRKGIFPAMPAKIARNGKALTSKRVLVYIAGTSHEECGAYEARMREALSKLRQPRGRE